LDALLSKIQNWIPGRLCPLSAPDGGWQIASARDFSGLHPLHPSKNTKQAENPAAEIKKIDGGLWHASESPPLKKPFPPEFLFLNKISFFVFQNAAEQISQRFFWKLLNLCNKFYTYLFISYTFLLTLHSFVVKLIK